MSGGSVGLVEAVGDVPAPAGEAGSPAPTAQPAAAAICPDCGLFITGAFWPDDHAPTAAEHLAEHMAKDHP